MGARYDRRPVQRLRFSLESTFGADRTGDVAANFYDIRHMPTAIARGTLVEADNTVRQRFFQQRNRVLGPDRGSVAVEAYLVGSNEAIVAAVTSPTKTPQSRLMEAILGGYSEAAGGSAVEASPSPTTTAFTVGAGHGARFAEGQIISVVVSGVAYPCIITDIATDALTVWPALPGAPAAAGLVYGAQNVHLDETDESSLQWLHETQVDRGNIWLLSGCQGDLSLTLNRGGLLTYATTQQGALYEHDDEIATPQGASALSAASYTGSKPLWGTEGGMHLGATSLSTRSIIRCVEFSLNLGTAWIEAGDYAGVEGIGEWERSIPETTAEITLLHDGGSDTYELFHDAFKAETDYGGLWWVGTPGSGVAVAIPTCQIMAAPEVVEVNGLEAIKLSLLVKENTKTGATSTTLQVSPVVIAQI
jgi:hypothetical protein